MRYETLRVDAMTCRLRNAFACSPAFRRSLNDGIRGSQRKGRQTSVPKLLSGIGLGAVLLLGFMKPALAVPISEFTFTYADGSHVLSFDLPTDPTPSFSGTGSFNIESVPVLVDGVAETGEAIFYTDGDFAFNELTIQFEAGFESIFSGPTSAPSFEDGSYVYTQANPGTLVITSTAAPEPSTWAMMLVGFAGLGFAGYRSRRPGLKTSEPGNSSRL